MDYCSFCQCWHDGPCSQDSDTYAFTGRGIYETLPVSQRTSWSPRYDDLTEEVRDIYNQAASQVERLRGRNNG